jgi:hypothetical protein
MTPHTFRPGQLSAESAAALSEMSRRLAGLDRLSVAPPLALARQGYDGQPVVYLDTSGLGAGYFFAQLTSGSSPYSWKERVETAAGTWADGPRAGTTNAYQVQPSAGSPSTPAANDVVLMRAAPGLAGVYEFVLADKASAGASLFKNNAVTTSDISLTSPTGLHQTILSFGLTNAGTYLVGFNAHGIYQTNTLDDYLAAQLTLAGAHVQGTRAVFCGITATSVVHRGSTSRTAVVTATAGQTLALTAARYFLGFTTAATIAQFAPDKATSLWAVQLP